MHVNVYGFALRTSPCAPPDTAGASSGQSPHDAGHRSRSNVMGEWELPGHVLRSKSHWPTTDTVVSQSMVMAPECGPEYAQVCPVSSGRGSMSHAISSGLVPAWMLSVTVVPAADTGT